MNLKLKNRILIKTPNLTFEDLIKKIDSNGDGFLPIVDHTGKLYGVVTDGDVRRAFIRKELDADKIINKNPITLPEGTSREKAVTDLKSRRRRHMPIVSTEGILVDLITLDEIDFETNDQLVVIMAGGLGKRLGELTQILPKPMLNVGDKPILEHIIINFQKHGFRNFAISVNYKSEVIKSHFMSGETLGARITYIEEEKQLGTAGALSLLPNSHLTNDVIVINGDVLSNVNFADLLYYHRNKNSDITLCSKEINISIPYAVLDLGNQNQILSLQEKPTYNYWINSGIYVLKKEMIDLIPKNTFFNMTELIHNAMSIEKNVAAYKTNEYWVDIGQIQDYEKARQDF